MGDKQHNRPASWCSRLSLDLARACFAFSIVVLAQTDMASGADWSATATLSQRMEVDDNRTVSDPSNGYVVGSTTSLATSISAFAPTQTFNLSHSINFDHYAGPGSDGLDDRFNFDDFSVSFSKNSKLTTYGLSSSFSRAPVSTTEFEDSGITNVNADRLTFSGGANVSRQINRRDSVSLSLSAKSVNFTNDANGLTPYFNANTSLAWSHKFNRRTSASVSSSVAYSQFDNDQNSRNWVFSSTVGLSHRLTKRISVSANIGARANRSEKDATFLLPASNETDTGFTGDFGLSYKRNSDTSLSLGWSQSLQPSSDGELKNRTSLNFGISHAINSRSSAAMSISASLQEPSSGSGGTWRKTLSVSPTYSYQLTPYWNANLGYLFRYSDSDTDTASSNKVFVSVSRKIIVVP